MFKKLIIPTDGSPLATTAALQGVELAGKIGAEVVGIFVAREKQDPVFDFSDIRPRNYPTMEEYRQAIREAGNNYMKPLRDAAEKEGVAFTPLVTMSNETAQHIVNEAAANGCDLIYMGSHGGTGWGKNLMGSVATKVFLASSIPILIYKFEQEQIPKNLIRKSYYNTLPV
jgi:nucleotide-binding universal stress UspA family protein